MGAGLQQLVDHLRRLVAPPDRVLDAVLLRRFVHGHEEDAFADLVARHGPMVLRVCQRVLADPAGAEDCFQATFLVLARRASSVRRPESLASWLHGVALHVAAKARKAGNRRQLDRLPANASEISDPHPDPLTQLTVRELLVAVDEEVERLPEVYRLPVILCCLENLSKEETARRLGWTVGSVKARLERGRKRLEARLAKRGFGLSAGLAALTLGGVATAAVRPALRAATVKSAVQFSAGLTLSAGPALATAVMLAEAALRGIAAGRLKTLAWGIVVTLGLAGKIRTFSAEDDGSGKPGLLKLASLAFSPDGKMMAACGYFPRIHIWDLATGKAISQLDGANRQGSSVAFSPDGHMLASTGDVGVVELWEVATGQRRKAWVAHPGKCMSLQFAPDGRSLATGGYDTTAIIWDPTGLRTHDAAKTIPKLSAKELDKSWADLAGQDAAAAYAAMCTLVAAPQDSVAFLRARLHPSPEISKERLQTLFTNLANSEFSVRQAAFNELKELGETITDHLRRATAENPELEVKRRVELLLEAARVPRADMLRRIRAIEVLEYIGSDDARQLLATISRGFPYARETKDAKAALERLAKRARKRL